MIADGWSAMTPNIASFIYARLKLSIMINGISVSMENCVDALERFCKPLMFLNDDNDNPVSIFGSSLLFFHGGRNIILLTKHQLDNSRRQPQEVSLIIDAPRFVGDSSGKIAFLPDSAVFLPKQPNSENYRDIVLVEFPQKCDRYDVTPYFLNLNLEETANLSMVDEDKIITIFAVGYPTESVSYDPGYDESGESSGPEFVFGKHRLYFEMAKCSPFDKADRIHLRALMSNGISIMDPDGLSGAPVFFTYIDDGQQAHLGFAGIITDASKDGLFAVYGAGVIKDVIFRCLTTSHVDRQHVIE